MSVTSSELGRQKGRLGFLSSAARKEALWPPVRLPWRKTPVIPSRRFSLHLLMFLHQNLTQTRLTAALLSLNSMSTSPLFDGKSTVAVPDEVFVDSTPLWEDFLIGRFPTAAPHVAKIHVIVNKIWNLGDKNIKIDAYGVSDTTVKFRIRHESARLRVLRRGMWNICNLPMVVSKWSPFPEEAQPELKTMSMWVVIKNVPHSMFTWKGLSCLASPVGHPKRLHQETELVTHFDEAKIFVEVDLKKELPKTYYFQVQGDEVCVHYEYPWLPPRCGACWKWGHSESGCLASLGKVYSSLEKPQSDDGVEAAAPISPLLSHSSPVHVEPTPTAVVVVENREVVVVENREVVVAENREVAVEPTQTEVIVAENSEVVVAENREVVVAENNREVANLEKEEGEIPLSPVIVDAGQENVWLNVSSGGKTSKISGKALVYGEVRIASPTRFDALRDNDEEGDDLFSSIVAVDPPANPTKQLIADLDKTQPLKSVKPGLPPRATLPRNSKSAHKFLSDSTQKAKDDGPSNVSKRNPQKKT